jgi:hypothetical protein
MIEWVPIKEFIKQEVDEDETFLVLRKNSTSPSITNILSFHKDEFLERFTHAAKINLPVEKTLKEKFQEWYKFHNLKWENDPDLCLSRLTQIAKEHYEGKE